MNNTLEEFQLLLNHTLEHIKTEYNREDTLLISEENRSFFASLKKVAVAPPPPLPQHPPSIVKVLAPQKIIEKPAAPPKAEVIQPPKVETPPPSVKPTAKSASIDFSEEIKKQVQKALPFVTIVRDVPNDDEAKLLSESWKQPTKYASVLIFSFSESAETEKFLFNIKKAIDAHLGSCAIIEVKSWEEKKEWEAFFSIHSPKLIISSPEMFKTKHLLSYYKENLSSKERFLHTHAFMLLSPLSTYLKQPEQKKILWNSLCTLLKKST